jgi:carboxymethylenebutenolidase
MIIRSDETLDVAVSGAGSMRTHLARPAVAGRFPGVLLFSEIYQVTDPIRRLAAMVAGQGYLVAIPEVYHEYEPAGAALNSSVSAAACFYPTDIHSSTLGAGKSDDSLARMTDLKAETLFVFGRQDPHVPFAGRETIRARLEEVGARYEWHEVNAAHAFLRDEGPRYDPALLVRCIDWAAALFARTLHRA